ncbi:hypothetical protein [Acinetobacter larvae]|uniref:NlpC/P60 domain-containing protein n=1 Tax=Acinetobacter larvae TaxID=1789224 RepID=A0A1B2LZA6_9GAMM|nr:hypothetical protein [Acinetobacter larvae]AOA58239.1 hypothetical protein BFG52_07650 [Acinetobacter larvae]
MIEQLLNRERRADYDCQDFVNEAWELITGEDLAQRLLDHQNHRKLLERLDEPVSPCLVYFSSARYENHVGLFYSGKVLHLANAAQYVPLDLIFGFDQCEFYR